MIYDDFREYIDQNDNLCMLKTLNYQAGQKPDYSDCIFEDVKIFVSMGVELF